MHREESAVFIFSIALASAILSAGLLGFSFNPSEPSFSIGRLPECPSADYSVFFCPADACEQALINEIREAESFIHAAVFSFTLESVADELIIARNKGVEVKVVVDYQQSASQYSVHQKLLEAGVDVVIDSNSGLMHNKFAVIDGKKIVTGSFNWTKNASEKNRENLLVIISEELASYYEAEFIRIYYS